MTAHRMLECEKKNTRRGKQERGEEWRMRESEDEDESFSSEQLPDWPYIPRYHGDSTPDMLSPETENTEGREPKRDSYKRTGRRVK